MKRAITHIAGFLLCLIVLGLLTGGLRAHGIGTPQLLNEPAGPYLISAWTDPDPLRADETHVVVAVADLETQEMIVTGVAVTVTMTSLGAPPTTLSEVAGTDNVNRLLYAAEFNDRVTEGRWAVTISVTGEPGAGETDGFEVAIGPARGFNWLWIGVGGLSAMVVVWLALSMRGEKPDRPPGRRKAN